MIIWSGLGFLVPLSAVLLLFGMNALVGDAVFNSHGWPKSVALFISAILVTLLGFYLRNRPGRVVIDKASGREMQMGRRDSVFFIPVIYWGAIYGVLGIYYMFVK